MWQLKASGDFAPKTLGSSARTLDLDPNVKDQLDGLDPLQLASADQIRINFASHADGRGFSLAKQFAEQFKSSKKPPLLVAVGKLIPDQARLAFQSGFDLIEIEDEEVERHSEASWRNSLLNAVPNIYLETHGTAGSSANNIWAARQAAI